MVRLIITDDEFLESLKAAVISRVADRLHLLTTPEGDDTEDRRGCALLAKLVNDFPFLDVAWNGDPERLRTLASFDPSAAARLGASSSDAAADANADLPSPKTPSEQPLMDKDAPQQRKRKRKANASKIVRVDDEGDDWDDDYIPEDDERDDDKILTAKKSKKAQTQTERLMNYRGVNSPDWKKRMEQCKAFKAEHGHLIIPRDHPELGSWAAQISLKVKKYRNEGRSESAEKPSPAMQGKLRQLEEIGFSLEYAFDRKLREFKRFKQRHGHVNVPSKHPLQEWIRNIRLQYNRMGKESRPYHKTSFVLLTLDRMRRLTEAGFDFQRKVSPATPWEVRLEQLRKFKEENGHLRVLKSRTDLGKFAQDLRRQYKQKHPRLTPERKRDLDEMGFCWEIPDKSKAPPKDRGRQKSWDEYFAEFKKFRAEHGHPYVPQLGDGSDESVRLGRWVANQRKKYKLMRLGSKSNGTHTPLSVEKALKLAEAGFAWDASRIRWTSKGIKAVDDARAS